MRFGEVGRDKVWQLRIGAVRQLGSVPEWYGEASLGEAGLDKVLFGS